MLPGLFEDCPKCFGVGIRVVSDSCPNCSGSGEIIEMNRSRLCPDCLGQTITERYVKCEKCGGSGHVQKAAISSI